MHPDAGGFRTRRLEEVARKSDLLAALARQQGLSAILLSAQHNFSWLSAGGSNRVDGLRESGVATLMVTAEGGRYLLANTIESARISQEALGGLGFSLLDFPWEEERADPATIYRIAAEASGGTSLASDVPTGHAQPAEGWISPLRQSLDEGEVGRYSSLCEEAARIVGTVARGVEPGATEKDVAQLVACALVGANMRPAVLLVGADDRIAAFRHPAPTDRVWHDRVLIAVCAEREGLITALTRIVSVRRDEELELRTQLTARVLGALLGASVAGATGSTLYAVAQKAYADAGFPGEERLHHQGGVIAYRSREWVAHPASREMIRAPQALAWNPTITGTKIEETCLLHPGDGIEVLTTTAGWPSIAVDVRSQQVHVAGVLVLDA